MYSQQFNEKILLDDSFVKCFAPIHVVQAFLGSSRANIEKNYISRPSAEQKLYTFIWIICFTVSLCYFELHYYKQYHDKDTILLVTCITGTFVQYVSYLCNIIHVRFCENTSSTDIYRTIQKIDTILPLKQYKHLKDNQFYSNIVLLVLIIGAFESGFIYYVVSTVEYPIFTIFWGMGLLITYLDILLTGSLIYYLSLRLKYLNKIIKYNVAHKNHHSNDSPPFTVNQDLRIAADGSTNLDLDKFLLSLREILKSYKMITEVFSFTVFNVAATTFIWTLLIIESIVEDLRGEFQAEVAVISASLWIVFYFIVLTALALMSDTFIQEARQTKLHSIYVMSYRFEGPLRKGASDIYRTLEYMQPVFSVYGIFILDKSLPVKLIGIITTNVVVLIQFTLSNN